MSQVVVFGNGMVAKLAHFYLTHDSAHDVVAFCVDREHARTDTLLGLPVVPFDEVVGRYPPTSHRMFVAVGYGRMNKFREERYNQAKALGYELISYISSKSTIWPEAVIGDNCFIMEHNVIQPFTRLGNDITMWSGSHVGHESVIKDHCFISSQVVISGMVTIEPNCFIGVNATIRDQVTIARECVIGAGALITFDTQEREVYRGTKAERLPMTSDRLPSV
jgi:sugar O-acyltransferase (sialic acid O-acetyltransferase NeuD family)